jgi:hypothetical protein
MNMPASFRSSKSIEVPPGSALGVVYGVFYDLGKVVQVNLITLSSVITTLAGLLLRMFFNE